MASRSTFCLLVVAIAVSVSTAACTTAPESPAGRSAVAPILGVPADTAGTVPECSDLVVTRTPSVPFTELTVSGQSGDVFEYRIERRDGTVATGTSGTFGAGQHDAILATGVANADVASLTVTARGTVGTGGTCAITTIR